jgi:hypothetical protein
VIPIDRLVTKLPADVFENRSKFYKARCRAEAGPGRLFGLTRGANLGEAPKPLPASAPS